MNKANRPILYINSYSSYVSESVLRAVVHDHQDRRRPFALFTNFSERGSHCIARKQIIEN